MQLVYQPYGSNLCGAACVASILEITLDEATELIGKKGLTRTRMIRDAFAKREVILKPRQTMKDRVRGVTYLARVRWPDGKHTHWVILTKGGRVFDPAFGLDPDWKGGYVSSIYEVAVSPLKEIRDLALQATRMLDTIGRDELSGDKYQTLKDAVKKVHRVRQIAGG
jgi:hypothetical protein